VVGGIEGEDAKRLERLAEARGKKPADVVAELLREGRRTRRLTLTFRARGGSRREVPNGCIAAETAGTRGKALRQKSRSYAGLS
jgi:riboflavin synthase